MNLRVCDPLSNAAAASSSCFVHLGFALIARAGACMAPTRSRRFSLVVSVVVETADPETAAVYPFFPLRDFLQVEGGGGYKRIGAIGQEWPLSTKDGGDRRQTGGCGNGSSRLHEPTRHVLRGEGDISDTRSVQGG